MKNMIMKWKEKTIKGHKMDNKWKHAEKKTLSR